MGPSLAERRIRACRLDPKFALDVFADAEAFLADRGMLTLTPSCSLPSLFGVCHEEPHSPGKAGYGQYPKTRWWWGGELEQSAGVVTTKLHRGRTLFLMPRIAAIVDPLCREESAAAASGEHAWLVAHLRASGPALTDDVKAELSVDAKHLQRARTALEKVGVVLTRHTEVEAANGGHRHVGELSLWDQVVPRSAEPDPLVALLVAGVAACVVAPEREVKSWFTWKLGPDIVDRAIERSLVARVGDNMVLA